MAMSTLMTHLEDEDQ